MKSLFVLLSTLAGAVQGSYWCLADNDSTVRGEFFGKYRDYVLYKVNKKTACVKGKISGKAERKDGLWVMEFDADKGYESALANIKKASIPILYTDANLKNILARGGLDLPDKTDLDACGGEVGTSVIPVPVTSIRNYPSEHFESAEVNPTLRLLLQNANTTLKNDPKIAQAMEHISVASLESTISKLQAYETRNSYSQDIHHAKKVIEDLYKSYGFTTSTFNYRSDMPGNVVAIKEGKKHSDKALILGAHYDSRSTNSNSPTQRAPGADDNGSGMYLYLEPKDVGQHTSTSLPLSV